MQPLQRRRKIDEATREGIKDVTVLLVTQESVTVGQTLLPLPLEEDVIRRRRKLE